MGMCKSCSHSTVKVYGKKYSSLYCSKCTLDNMTAEIIEISLMRLAKSVELDTKSVV
jgi:hypothetical protein